VDKRAVAQGLEQIAALLELRGENPFRVRAFRAAAKAVAALSGELGDHLADGSLAATKGVGPATLQIVQELASTGRSSLLDELRGQVPPGLVEMLQISGLGVAKVRQLHEALGIDSLPELEAAARDGRLAKLPRFGARTAENILRSIAFLRQASAFRLAHHAAEEAEALRSTLAALPGVTEAVIAGEVRRRMEVVRETAIVVVASVPPEDLLRPIGEMPGVQEISGQDERRATLKIEGGAHAQVVVTTPKNVGAVLVQATGNAEHLAALSAHARERGFSLDGAALWHGNSFVPTPDEASLYQALGLAFIPPELREGQGEIAAAAAGSIPALIGRGDLQGFLHCHTVASDGSNTVEELARACLAAGYAWAGITDHSKTAAYAGGLSADDLARQADEIDVLNQRIEGIRILKGIEADILVDGALDYDDSVLSRLDFVIGSIHSRFNLDRDTMTARMLAAIDNPYLTILGHPTGRLLLSRDPYAIDMERVIEKAGAAGVAIEINADPHRLDLDWRLLRQARAAGVMISIGADAHNVAGLANVEFGIGIARKGWLTAADVLNARAVDGFLAFARARRGA
jgi:DNA polymerase (family 10)